MDFKAEKDNDFHPTIIAFLCKWCSSAGSDLAGVSRLQYPPNVIPITIMCSGSASPLFILSAFNKGADGVLISGCHPGDCHYIKGNYYARRRLQLLKKILDFVGIQPQRFKISWISAAEGAKFTQVVDQFVNELIPLGPQTRLRRIS